MGRPGHFHRLVASRHCLKCQARTTLRYTIRWPTLSLPLPNGPGILVRVDCFGLLPLTPRRNAYILFLRTAAAALTCTPPQRRSFHCLQRGRDSCRPIYPSLGRHSRSYTRPIGPDSSALHGNTNKTYNTTGFTSSAIGWAPPHNAASPTACTDRCASGVLNAN